MMRRAPLWFTNAAKRERFHTYWPWALGALCAGLYQYNPFPFDDVMTSGMSAVRKPLLGFLERVESFDIDPEMIALELPPDQLFGPLPLRQQIFFALQALEEENELGDAYITRIVIDLLDFGLDPPALGNTFVEAGGSDLFREAIKRYRAYDQQTIRFFNHDQFIRLASISCEHPTLAQTFLKEKDSVSLVLSGIRASSDEYSRHLGLRALTQMAIFQHRDGEVERRICKEPVGISTILDVYNKASGDPHETRYATTLLSSILRVVPSSADVFLSHDGLGSLFRAFNITMYKATPQHIRLFEDIHRLRPQKVNEFLRTSEDVVPIVIGVMNAYPDFTEAQVHLCELLQNIDKVKQCPSLLFSYGALSTFAKLNARLVRQEREDGTRRHDNIPAVSPDSKIVRAERGGSLTPSVGRLCKCISGLANRILEDNESQKYFEYSPEVRLAVSDMRKFTSVHH